MKLLATCMLVLSLAATSLIAQEQDAVLEQAKEMFKMELRSMKRDVIAMNIPFTDKTKEEAFWDIYEEYEDALKSENKKYINLLKKYATNYETMDAKIADQMVKELYKLKKTRQKIELKTYKKMAKSVSAIEAARFVQINNRLGLLLDLGIASHLPMLLPEGISVTEDGAVIQVPAK